MTSQYAIYSHVTGISWQHVVWTQYPTNERKKKLQHVNLIVQPMQHLLSINVFNKCCTLNNGYCNCADNFDLGEWCKDGKTPQV